jgi:RES domain-containing protein
MMSKSDVHILWRISKRADLRGMGGKFAPGRWHTQGVPILYLAESPAGALLESLVHLEFSRRRLPETYTLLKIEAPEDASIFDIEIADSGWRQNLEWTQLQGNEWLGAGKTLLARVPSAVVPYTWNVLMNPLHQDAAAVRIAMISEERFDTRLFRLAESRLV